MVMENCDKLYDKLPEYLVKHEIKKGLEDGSLREKDVKPEYLKEIKKECGMNKSVKGEQEWPPKKVWIKNPAYDKATHKFLNLNYDIINIGPKPK